MDGSPLNTPGPDGPRMPDLAWAGYRDVPADSAVRGNRSWWTEATDWYLAEHGAFLGDDDFLWCPEGLRESEARLLGDVAGRRIAEIGCGAAQCSRWLAGRGALPVGVDLAEGMLAAAKTSAIEVPLVQADARTIPFADRSIDLAFSAYGALPFVAEIDQVHQEVLRILRPGGRWVFAVTHPIRAAFPDDPGPTGLTADRNYFDRTPYVETDEDGRVIYAEFHHTLADQVSALAGAGFVIDGLVEPEWPAGLERVWGGWSPLRGRRLPGTTIWRAHRPG